MVCLTCGPNGWIEHGTADEVAPQIHADSLHHHINVLKRYQGSTVVQLDGVGHAAIDEVVQRLHAHCLHDIKCSKKILESSEKVSTHSRKGTGNTWQ